MTVNFNAATPLPPAQPIVAPAAPAAEATEAPAAEETQQFVRSASAIRNGGAGDISRTAGADFGRLPFDDDAFPGRPDKDLTYGQQAVTGANTPTRKKPTNQSLGG